MKGALRLTFILFTRVTCVLEATMLTAKAAQQLNDVRYLNAGRQNSKGVTEVLQPP